jgi:molybdate transport system permease protein
VSSDVLLSIIGLTLKVAATATLAMLPIAILLGYWLARTDFRGKAVAQALVALPMVLPPVAVGFALLVLLARRGPLGSLWTALGVDISLGLGSLRTFFAVTLPLARRGVLYGTLLAFTRALGEFGATALVAGIIPGRTETVALGIYSRVLLGDDTAALWLCAASFSIALVAMLIAEGWLRREPT